MNECNLVPAPHSCQLREGSCGLSFDGSVSVPEKWAQEREILTQWIHEGPNGAPRVRVVCDEAVVGKEAYRLHIAEDGATLVASDGAGVIRGAATLRELVLSSGPRLACLDIEDEPRFSWRGFMLDTARNFFRVEFLEKMIDAAAMHKLNVFHWHLTDDQAWRLDLNFAPEVAAQGGIHRDVRYQEPVYRENVYTHADIARIVEFAKSRHVLVVPEIEMPGHVTALLASHPEFCCLGANEPGLYFEPEYRFGIFEDILCAGNDAVLKFVDQLVEELCSLFPSPVIHMGGDEAPKTRWLSCPRCRQRMITENLMHPDGSLDPEKLQAWFMEQIQASLAKQGRRMAGWDEVVEGDMDKSVVVFGWRGNNMGKVAAGRGYDVVMCPQTKACYLDHKQEDSAEEPGQLGVCTLEDSYSFDPISPELSGEEAKHILGGQGNLWTELIPFGRQAEYMLYPRLCALSEVFWSPKSKRNFQDFSQRMQTHGTRLDLLDIAWRRSDVQKRRQ